MKRREFMALLGALGVPQAVPLAIGQTLCASTVPQVTSGWTHVNGLMVQWGMTDGFGNATFAAVFKRVLTVQVGEASDRISTGVPPLAQRYTNTGIVTSRRAYYVAIGIDG